MLVLYSDEPRSAASRAGGTRTQRATEENDGRFPKAA